MRAADQSAGMMRLARWSAALIIVGVGAAAFRLSFSTLQDLARISGMPAADAWLFPLIVDGTILLATFGVLVCANHKSERRFFLGVLIVGSLVSVAGNAIHAVVATDSPLGLFAAVVAAVAPISLLVDTHGLALLFRVSTKPEPEPAPEKSNTPTPAPAVDPEPVPVLDPAPTPAPAAPVPAPTPAPAVVPSRPRPVRPAQTMLPIAVPVGGTS
ncbi:DUF2637 domain-containing protein [Nocardia sp. NPDC003345]